MINSIGDITKSLGGRLNLNAMLGVNMMMILGAYRFCISNAACHWPRGENNVRDIATKTNRTIYCLPENCGMIFNKEGELLMTVGSGTEIL